MFLKWGKVIDWICWEMSVDIVNVYYYLFMNIIVFLVVIL